MSIIKLKSIHFSNFTISRNLFSIRKAEFHSSKTRKNSSNRKHESPSYSVLFFGSDEFSKTSFLPLLRNKKSSRDSIISDIEVVCILALF